MALSGKGVLMKKHKVLSCIISAALSFNIPVNCLTVSQPVFAETAAESADISGSEYVGTEHAYDPLAELEAEEAEKKYRENADIEANKVLFSVIGNKDGYLDDNSDICGKYELHNITLIYESGENEVFYEAETVSDDIWSLVDELRGDESIASAEPVFVWKKSAIGEAVEVSEEEFKRASHFSLLDTENVWKSLKNSSAPGKGVVVAVIDTGVDYNHKDLADNIWTNPNETPGNGVDDDNNGYVDDIHGINATSSGGYYGDMYGSVMYAGDPMDDHGHGTHVAGAIAMTAGNGGGIGLAYGAKIMCIKAGSADGNFASNDIARAIKYAADNGADVINMSFGGEEKSTLVETALKDAAKDAVLVASAGNDGLPTSEAAANGYKNCKDVYPAGYNCVIGVMASDNNDKLACFSNWDYISGKGCEYEMAAPGTEIYSTLPDNRYAVWSGTSLSASCVSAAAAIIRSEYPNKNKYDARYIMGQLINASSSKATAEPAVVTTPVVTESATTTAADPVTTVSTTTVISDDPLVNADADGSGGIDKSDFTAILKGIVGLNVLGGSMGDVNCDGSADMFDAVSVLRLCDSKDNLSAIMDSATIRKEYVTFDVPSIDITEDGDYKNYKFTYNADYPFKAVTGQLKYNGKAYSGEFKEIKLLDSTNDDIIYEFNPENGKVAAYSAGNETSGSFTISLYEGKDGAYTIDPSSLKFYDENGKEYLGYSLGMFDPVLNIKSAAQSVAAVGTPTAVAVYDKKVEYPRLNIMDSLTVKPHPDLRIDAVEMLETSDIFESNNGDGIVQPGETVGLGISLWNGWGAASDVNVKIEAVGADGKANPYVEVLDSSIDFGNIATFSGADNGLTYSDGKVKSISTPVRIKVKDDAPNDGKMTFKITVTAKNGFETEDTETYTTDTEYSFIVQRIEHLPSKIKKDTTLDKSRLWIVDGEVTIMDGVILTINPGTQVQFGCDDSNNTSPYLHIGSGALICKGTEIEPISLFNTKNYGGISYYSGSLINMEYTEVLNLRMNTNYIYNYNNYFFNCDNSNFDHCRIVSAEEGYEIPGKISNSIIYTNTNIRSSILSLYVSNAENCLFNSIMDFYRIFNHTYNVYVGDINGKGQFYNNGVYDKKDYNKFNYNAILNNYNVNRGVYSNTINTRIVDYDAMIDRARNNYYGTENPKLIGIPDDAVEEYPDIYDSFLTLDSPEIENIYPFMTEAYITNEKGERLENAYPGQSVLVHVKFNRDMAIDIQPDVTVGINWDRHKTPGGDSYSSYGAINYTNYDVSGNWISSKEWVGYLTLEDLDHARFLSDLESDYDYFYSKVVYNFDSVKLDDILYIRSEGAVAADDRWLVTGTDGGRFGFNVVKPATIQSITLKGSGASGANQLTWAQDEMETLAGYNIYRSTDNQYFTKINKSLLSNEDLQYTDKDVVTGQKYYYYYRAVDTDFNESKPSNTVECIPLDKDKPQIVHTPVTDSEPDKTITISANVTDNVKVDSVTLFYKYSDEQEWNSESMRNPSGSTYNKIFSQYEVRKGQLQYYIEATDGINKANVGSKEKPCVIDIKPYVATTSATAPASTTSSTSVTTVKSGTSSTVVNNTTGTTTVYGPNTMTTTSTTTNWILPGTSITVYSPPVNDKQIIKNVYVYGTKANSEMIVSAEVDTVVNNITLYYKYSDNKTWNSLGMSSSPKDSSYKAVLPASKIREGTLEYYIEASDGINIEKYGSRTEPYTVKVTASSIVTQTTTTTSYRTTTTTTTITTTTTTTTTTAEQPKILNVIISKAKVNEGIKAESDITGNGDISAVLFYKYAEDSEWSRANMTKGNGSAYSAYIPGYESRQGTLQYYVEASCGKNTAYFGSAEKPFRIVVMPETTTTKLTTTVTTTSTTITTRISPTTTTSSSTTSTTTTRTTSSTSSSSMTTSVSSTSSTSKPASSTTTNTGTTGTTTSTVTNPPLITGDTSVTISDAEPYKIPLAQNEEVTFVSNNTDVAIVSADGVVTPVGEGEVVIFIIDKNNNVIRLKITVRHKENAYMLGDVNNDGKINAVDASEVLTYYAMISTNQNGDFNEAQKLAADVNNDGKINAVDASCILSYYAYTSTAKEAIVSLEEYLKKNS